MTEVRTYALLLEAPHAPPERGRGETRSDTGFRYVSCWGRRTVEGALGAGGGPLVAGVARDTHDCGVCWRWWLAAVSIFFPSRDVSRGKRTKDFTPSGDCPGKREAIRCPGRTNLEAVTRRQSKSRWAGGGVAGCWVGRLKKLGGCFSGKDNGGCGNAGTYPLPA